MDPKTTKSKTMVSHKVIVYSLIVLSPVIFWGLWVLFMQLQYLPIRGEISRIASISGLKPLSIECDSGLDIGTVCRAEYNELTEDEHSKMLKDSGYTVDMGPDDGSGYISATNSKVHIYADGGPGWEGSGFEDKTIITYQLNDYQN
ncbi:MAG: hypothetical protein ABWX90_00035 [Candidatus Saccharimonadales bacterium]